LRSVTSNKPDKQDTPDNNNAAQQPDTPDKPAPAQQPDTPDKPAQAHKPDKQAPACNNCQAQTTSYDK
jgi:hypothetical protein